MTKMTEYESETPRAASLEERAVNDIDETIVQSVESLARASSPPAVWSVMKAIAAAFGFERMIVLEDCQDPTLSALSPVLYDDAPSHDRQDLDHNAQWRSMLSQLRACATSKPFFVGEISQAEQRRAFEALLAPLGASNTLLVPVARLLEFKGVILLASKTPGISPIARSALHVLAHCAFDRVHALEHEPKRREFGILSPREAECLHWAAAGKTDNEIGAILSISPRTARFHIENAKKKLGVSTRIQAVTEALRLKAIAA